jgi:hypothetical protein
MLGRWGQGVLAMLLEATLSLIVVKAGCFVASQALEGLVGRYQVPLQLGNILDIAFLGLNAVCDSVGDIDAEGPIVYAISERTVQGCSLVGNLAPASTVLRDVTLRTRCASSSLAAE